MEPEQTDALVVALRAAARDLTARPSIADLEHAVARIVAAAVDTVPGADAGGISLTKHGRITSRCPTNDDIGKLDEIQTELDEGPCVTAVEQPPDDGVVVARDLSEAPDAERWPRFAPRVVEHGYRSMLSTELSVDQGVRAALNLYSRAPGTFTPAARTLAGLFGVQAAMLLYGVDQSAHLSQALETRDVIGKAKGIVMERFDVEDDQAFQMLVRSSQDTNLKLVEVARWLTSRESRHDPIRPDGGPGS